MWNTEVMESRPPSMRGRMIFSCSPALMRMSYLSLPSPLAQTAQTAIASLNLACFAVLPIPPLESGIREPKSSRNTRTIAGP